MPMPISFHGAHGRIAMANVADQDLEYHELSKHKDLPFRIPLRTWDRLRKPDDQFDFISPSKVQAARKYRTRFPGSFMLKKISLDLDDPGQGISQQDKDAFLREARALRYAHHRHVVQVALAYAFQGENEHPYFAIVMDRAEGDISRYTGRTVDLRRRLRDIPGWFGCLASVVEHIHVIGIRHRDIKPQNILQKNRSILLADFGISQMGLGKTLPTTIPMWARSGTAKYAAPEAVDGSTRGRAADIFSLGAVFLELLIALGYDSMRPTLSQSMAQSMAQQGQPSASFSRQLGSVREYMDRLDIMVTENWHRDIIKLCREMMTEDREERPSAERVRWIVSKLSPSATTPGPCQCGRDSATTASEKLVDACKRNDGIQVVRWILNRDRNLRDTIGAIHQASTRGYHDIVEALLDYKTNQNLLTHSNQTALHCAARNGHESIVVLLLRRGASARLVDDEGNTPLHCASAHGYRSIVEKLLAAEAGENASRGGNTYVKNSDGQTALHLAARRGHLDVIKALSGKWNDARAFGLRDKKGRTAIHLAAGSGSKSTVEYLLQHAGNPKLVNAQDENGWTALHFAAGGKQRVSNYSEVIRCLLKYGAFATLKAHRPGAAEMASDFARKFGHQERLSILEQALYSSQNAPFAASASYFSG